MSAPGTAETLLSIRELTIDFRTDDATTLRAVDHISFDIPVNSTVALVANPEAASR